MIIPYGTLINSLAIIAGGSIGLLCGSRLPERVRTIVFQGLGLCILLIGFKMALITEQPLILIFSILIGAVSGELLQLERCFTKFGDFLKKRFKSSNPKFTEGMVNSSVLFCIGAMAILGSFDEGMRDDRTIILSKAILDGFAAMAFASAYGVGVLFSAIPILIYQGSLTMLAGTLQPWLAPSIMNELTAVGGTLIIGIGLNLLDVVKIPLSNMIPSLLVVVVLATFMI